MSWSVWMPDWLADPAMAMNFLVRDVTDAKERWRRILRSGDYETVCGLKAKDAEDCFHQLNQDDRSNRPTQRSMSVGDVAVNLTTKRVFLCVSLGFVEIVDEDLVAEFTS